MSMKADPNIEPINPAPCFCSGDIDDAFVVDEPAYTGCADDDLEGEEYDPNEDYEGAIGPDSICRECGCHPYMACTHPEQGNCSWAELATADADGNNYLGPLCSHCAMKLENVTRPWQTKY
jgi:hypothetical protein